jgi:hypothetical protein
MAAQAIGESSDSIQQRRADVPADLAAEYAADQRASECADNWDGDEDRTNLRAGDDARAKTSNSADALMIRLAVICHKQAPFTIRFNAAGMTTMETVLFRRPDRSTDNARLRIRDT